MTEQQQNAHDDVFDIEEPKKSGGKSWITIVLLVLLAGVAFFVFKNPVSSGLANGDSVSIAYSAILDDGTVIDEVSVDAPQVVVVGAVPNPVFNTLLVGMKEGDSKKISMSPEDGAGKYYDPGKVKKVPKVLFDNLGEEVVIDKQYTLGNISGVAIRIEGEGSAAKVVLDTNSPETRQNVNYEIRVIEIQ